MTAPEGETAGRAWTPGPWDYFVGNANGRGLIRIEAANDSTEAGHHIASMPRGELSEANAEFLTRACNSHEALVKALREMIVIYWGDGDGQLPEPECIQNARSALLLAGEKNNG